MYTHSYKGFTLVELLLYVTMLSIVLGATISFLSIFLEARVKNQVIAEIDQQGAMVLNLIAQTVRNAEAITTPSTGNTASSLTLDVNTPVSDPTTFALSSGTMTMTEGAGSAVPLTNSRVTVSGLSFSNLSAASTPGIVRVQFTLSYINPTGRQEYTYQKTFITSVSLRWP